MRACIECGERKIPLHTRKTVCSTACQNARRERQRMTTACVRCDRRMSYKAGSLCRQCRTLNADPTNRRTTPVTEWSCADCGTICTRRPTKGQRPKWCEGCRKKSRDRDWIPRAVRLGIYKRDGWTCWLCEETVNPALTGTGSPWRASLDHVQPRSLGGSNDPTNLKLAHVWCNTTRNDGRAYSPEDFRVSA